MSINRHAYRAIEAVVGKNYITDDPAVCALHLRTTFGISR